MTTPEPLQEPSPYIESGVGFDVMRDASAAIRSCASVGPRKRATLAAA